MPADYRQLTAFLDQLGITQIRHTERNYFAHLVAVYHLMRAHGQDDELCRAGLFHSIYGTEKFQGFKLPLNRRTDVAELIGQRAEQLAYWNCFMDRSSFDARLDEQSDVLPVRHRETGEEMMIIRRDFDDLCSVHLFDWLEQVPRSAWGWDYRRDAYRRMAERLGGGALEAYDVTFASQAAPP